MKPIVLALALASSAPAAFAADSTSARRYGSSEALSVQDARLGEVLMVRTVQLKSDQRLNAGSAIGAAVGYGAANQVKSRDYRNAARVAGGVIGGVAGTAVQKGLSGRRAVEIYVRDLSDRRQRVLAVVQDADVDVREGDRVFLVGKGKKTRVVPMARIEAWGGAENAAWGSAENASACGVGACGVSLGDMR
ncbi:glycine zipper 2TM domain-containing protein [Stenotrophomonas maltophilia]|uniref:glycine zipper 2TM domain-containing protein n=1 Tax=Stenotrophomonas maltophilia TaxID=40324 RepID=UPI001E2BF579|nr:glycine zipper 2TM domain-containing protein [Stenotrophomonas maltophilia]EMB2829629.1 glycine zipper 2TM domain-containing protein [Stenotrophomonas maltophilia]MBN5188905.1 glycine zipper 2TM domain-containing protein [Stenotrophomonas maltophilia]MDZ5800322.1 glycine zipper 2TM domain-containing protein [Stenotrophomonas maltophilia]UGB12707.1 glycine zipper 2TM domain-containing protein [Stenotrophomonas maltophilia]HDS1527825.1 glycine zipper 2TM domain-containing protein [Stenotropho